MSAPRPAATVVLLRPAPGGPEVLLLRRSKGSGFLPDAWVFPGGAVEPDDALVATAGEVHGLPPDQRPAAVAAVRECFEEAGVWLGLGRPPDALRERLCAGEACLSAAPGLRVDLGRLSLWARWVTPEVEPRRFDTLFFVADVRPGDPALADHDRRETVEHRWFRPADAIGIAGFHELFVVPPTFRTLEELAPFGSPEQVHAASRGRVVGPILPRREPFEGAVISVVLPGHPTYPAAFEAPGPKRIALVGDRWRSIA